MVTRFCSAVCIAWLVLAGACKSKEEGGPTLGTFTCKDVKDDACIGPTDRFEATVPVIHFTHTTKDIPKNGEVYKVEWIAEDVGTAAPANTVIDTFEEKVTDVVDGMISYTVNSSLTQPGKGFPKGAYRIDVKLGDTVTTTARFKID
jgi:hypothetical protein